MKRKLFIIPFLLSGLILSSCLRTPKAKSSSSTIASSKTSSISSSKPVNPRIVLGNIYKGVDAEDHEDENYEQIREIAIGSTVSFYANGEMEWTFTSEAQNYSMSIYFEYLQQGNNVSYTTLRTVLGGAVYEVSEEEKESYEGFFDGDDLYLSTIYQNYYAYLKFEYSGQLDTESPALPGSSSSQPTSSIIEEEGLKIGLIVLHDEDDNHDLNFISAFKQSASSVGYQTVIRTGISEDESAYRAASELASIGCNAVIATSYGHEDFVIQAARENPNVEFFHLSGVQAASAQLPNFHNAYASIYEGRYLTGMAAGYALQNMINIGKARVNDNGKYKVGFVAAYPYAEVISSYTAWYLGVKEVVSNVEMDVQFIHYWYNDNAEYSAAEHLIDSGSLIISDYNESAGAAQACEANGVPYVGYGVNLKDVYSHAYIANSRINWTPLFDYIGNNIKLGKSGESFQENITITLEDGAIDYDVVDSYAASFCHEAANQLLTEERQVFDCAKFTYDGGKTLTTYSADINGDFIPDVDVLKNKNGITYFAESTFCSAPYFDVRIDGINLINPEF